MQNDHLLGILVSVTLACSSTPASHPSAPIVARGEEPAPPPANDTATQAAPSAASTADNSTPELAANAFYDAIRRGDRAQALGLCLSFDEMSTFSKKVTDRAAFDREVEDYVDRLIRELAGKELRLIGIMLVGKKTSTVAENPEKVKRDVEIAWVEVSVDHEGAVRKFPAFTFLEVDGAWKLSTRRS